MGISSVVLSSMILVLPAWQATDEVQPLNVYMFARTVEEPLSKSDKKIVEKALKAKAKKVKKARETLDKTLKNQYGKKRDKWPEEQQEEYRRARELESMARVEIEYLQDGAFAKGKQQDLDNSVEDILRHIQGEGMLRRKQKWISLVENRDQAHLLVEIVDRRRPGKFKSFGRGVRGYWVTIKISSVETFSPNQLDDITPEDDGWGGWTRIRHMFRHEEPYWIMECGSDDMWGNTAALIASRLNSFIEDNRAVLKGTQ